MSEPTVFYTLIYVTSLLTIGLMLTMREFSRLNRREQLPVSKEKQADRLRSETTLGYYPGYSRA